MGKKLKVESSKFKVYIFVLGFSVLCSSYTVTKVYATTGLNRTINFQGKLVNKADGTNLSDGNYTFVFGIYNAASSGTKLWGDETQTSVPVTNGIFQVALGSVRSFATDNLDFNQDNLWLDVTFNGENFGSRIRLASVPYAFMAEKVSGLTVAANKTFAVNNSITFGGTDATSFTLPSTTGGTVLTTNQAAQTINSGQTLGTILALSAGAPALTGALTGLTVTMNGTNAQAQTGLSFTVTGTGTLKDINGTGGNWSVTSAGGGSFATLNSTGLLTASNGLTVSSGSITLSGLSVGSIPFMTTSNVLSQDNSNLFWDATNHRLGVGVNTNLSGVFDLRQTPGNGTLPVSTISGATSFAALVVNNSGKGDLFTASSSGLNRFVVTQNGNVGIGTNLPGATIDVVGSALLGANSTIDTRAAGTLTIGNGANTTGLTMGKSGATTTFNSTTWTATPTISGLITANAGLTISSGQNLTLNQLTAGSIPFLNASKVLSEDNANLFWDDTNNRFGIGVNTNLLGAFDVRGSSGTLPVATIAGKTSFAALVVNNSGTGDLMTASSAGLTKFVVNNSGSVLIKGDTISSSSSAVLSNNGSGAVVNALGDQGSMIPNAGFEANTSNSLLGDGWVKNATSSATIAIDTVQADAGQGTGSVKYTTSNTNQSAAFYSACVPLTGGVIYNLMYSQKAGAANGSTVRGYLDQYTSKANCQSNTSPTILGPTTSAATLTTYAVTGGALAATAATTAWGRAHIFIASSVNSANATTNIDSVRLVETALTSGLDYAENYPADPDNIPQPGEVVALQASGGASLVAPARKSMDQLAIGVVSSNPGQTLDDGNVLDPKIPVALAGRVPVKVSTINGSIHVGDYLTSSIIPGVAVKATTPGMVIGTAMQDDVAIDPTNISKITLFIKNTYYNGVPAQNSPVVMSFLQTPNLSGSNNLQVLDNLSPVSATNSADLRVKGNGLIEGMLHVVDTLFANNFIVNNVSEFFGKVMFHSDVSFAGRPTYNSDTAGFATIKKGSDQVAISFDKSYDQLPVVTANMILVPFSPTPEATDQTRQKAYQSLITNLQFMIINQTGKGFSILLNRNADDDINFAWDAIAVQHAKTFVGQR